MADNTALHTVNILEECLIAPPSGSVPPSSIPLTFFDLSLFVVAPPVNFMFYPYPHSKPHFIDTTLPNMKRCLSITLQHYYSLAGKVTWPQQSAKPEITYKVGDSVAFSVAESDYDFDHLSGNHARKPKEFSALVPKFKDVSLTAEKVLPILAVQVTLFPNNGICVAISVNHLAGDGRSCIAFIKSWASVCKSQGSVSFSLPNYDRSTVANFKAKECTDVLKNLENIGINRDSLHVMREHNDPPADIVRAMFVMGSAVIKRLKQWVSARLQNDELPTTFYLSSFMVTCAYVWVCQIKARWGDKGDGEAIEHLIVPADARARLVPPVPAEYFGNCFSNVYTRAKRGDLMGKNGIAIAAKVVRSAMQNLDINVTKDLAFLVSLPKGQVMAMSSPRFGIYEADFGWGRPKKSEVSTVDGGLSILLNECPDDGGGIEIYMARSKKEMDIFAALFAQTLSTLIS